MFQIAALPVVILAPLGAVSLLWNAVFARILLGDVFTSLMAIGTLLIAAGAVLIAVFGVVQEANHSLEELLELLRRPAFVVYFSLLTFAVLVVIVSVSTCDTLPATLSLTILQTHITEHTLPAIALPSSPKDTDVELPTTSVDTNERTPLIPNKIDITAARASPAPSIILVNPPLQRKRTLVALSYASLSGILSGMCIIFAKAGVELLLLTIGGKNQFWRWESWVLVGGLVVVALLQVRQEDCPSYQLLTLFIAMVSAQVVGPGRTYLGLPSGLLLLQPVVDPQRPHLLRPVLTTIAVTDWSCLPRNLCTPLRCRRAQCA